MPLQPGQVLNSRYRIVRLLGQGSIGAVYRAWDINLNRPCAVQEYLVTTPEAYRQFARDANILASLSHPNLPRVTDHFILPVQGQYFVMDFIDGEELYSLIERIGPLSQEQAVALITEIANALSYLHNHQPPVIHRNVKPANIRITPDGRAFLVDFGLANIFDPTSGTTVEARIVSPGYSPPELYGRGTTDARADQYALAATLYFLLTGTEPIESAERMASRWMPHTHEINPRVSLAVSRAIERSMNLDPSQRFASVSEFKTALSILTPSPETGRLAVARRDEVAAAQPIGSAPAASFPVERSARLPPHKRGRIEKSPQKPRIFKQIKRYTRIELPEHCTIGVPVVLTIQLTEKVTLPSRALSLISIKVEQDLGTADLTVVVTAPGFSFDETQKNLGVPLKGDSPNITFTLTPKKLGVQVVEVEFYQTELRVGHVLVASRILQPASIRSKISSVKPLLIRDPGEEIHILPATQPFRTLLHINYDETSGQLIYSLPRLYPNKKWASVTKHMQEQISTSLQELDAFLYDVATVNPADDAMWESVCLNMRAFGENLHRILIPPPGELVKILRNTPNDTQLIISTNEQWVPWELLHDGVDYWAKRFILARYPRPSNSEVLPRKGQTGGQQRKKQAYKIVNVVGSGLGSGVSASAVQLFDNAKSWAQVETLQERTVSELRKALPARILHCTCHGWMKPHILQIGPDSTRLSNLPPETVSLLPIEKGGLVFANACASSTPSLFFGQFQSFGWEFYLRGADAFVGTLGPIPAMQAVRFGELFYNNLFKPSAPMPLGSALAETRKTMEKERNLFWLMYCLYGNPNYQIRH